MLLTYHLYGIFMIASIIHQPIVTPFGADPIGPGGLALTMLQARADKPDKSDWSTVQVKARLSDHCGFSQISIGGNIVAR
jgi:hypothetical protein